MSGLNNEVEEKVEEEKNNSIITPEILYELAYNYSNLSNSWYLYVISILTELNLPEEIPKILHFTIFQQLYKFNSNEDKELIVELGKNCILSSEKYLEMFKNGDILPDLIIPHNDNLLYNINEDEIIEKQKEIIDKIREILLKISMFVGMPKSINSFMILISSIPKKLLTNNFKRNQIFNEDPKGIDTINGKISQDSININSIILNLIQGSKYFKTFYKNSSSLSSLSSLSSSSSSSEEEDIKNQMLTAYPDLWYYIYHHIYSPLLGFNDIIGPKETSLGLISCILPQNLDDSINDEYFQSAINFGCTIEEISNIKQLVLKLCEISKSIN